MFNKTAAIVLLFTSLLIFGLENLWCKEPAGIPDRDYTLWGTVYSNESPLTKGDNKYTLSLKIDGQNIISYTMGDDPLNGDRYVLRVPMSVGEGGPGVAQAGDIAHIYANGIGAYKAYLEPGHQAVTFPLVIGKPAGILEMSIYLDESPPYVTGYIPPPNTTASIDTNIYMEIKDDGIGVDQSTIKMTVEGAIVVPTINPISGGYSLNYNPPENFAYGQEVNVTIYAADKTNPPNQMSAPYSYSFKIVENTPPTASELKITPQQPKTANNLTGGYTYYDSEGHPESSLTEIRWYRNDILQTEFNNKLDIPSSATLKGQVWHFTVRPHDGLNFGDLKTSPFGTIGNTVPMANNLKITPQNPKKGDNLVESHTYTDEDGDVEGKSEIRWYKNGVLQSEYNDQNMIPSTTILKSQVWYFTVRPYDGYGLGDLKTSSTVVIGNTAPVAIGLSVSPSFPTTNDDLVGNYIYNDIDGDSEVGSEIRWYKGGILQSSYNNALVIPASATLLNQTWYFTVKPKDGKDFGEIHTSPSVFIGNTPPMADDLVITPQNPKTSDDLVGSYTYMDSEGDPEVNTEIRWYKNGALQLTYNNLLTVPSNATWKGQAWHFTVKPHDGFGFGALRSSGDVIIGNTAPKASNPVLSPTSPLTYDDLIGIYSYSDIDGDPESDSEIKWYKDGNLQQAYNNKLIVPSSATLKNQAWHFTVKPKDESDFGDIQTSGSIVIGNTKPVASNPFISPASPLTSSNLVAMYNYSDADGDEESGSTIRWYKNENLQSAYNDQKVVPSSVTIKNQQWHFTVRPSDGTEIGVYQTSPIVVIGNSSPIADAGGIYQVKPGEAVNFDGSGSYDADGDPFTYSWDFGDGEQSEEEKPVHFYSKLGVFNVTLVVNDGTVDSASSNTMAYVGTDPSLVQQVAFDLVVGWNLISFRAKPVDDDIESVLTSIQGKYDSIWTQDVVTGEWFEYIESAPSFENSLSKLKTGVGYLIKMNKTGILFFQGTQASSAILLKPGKNMVGYNSQNYKTIEECMNPIAGKYNSVSTYDPDLKKWLWYVPDGPDFLKTIKYLQPGRGYIIDAKEECLWDVGIY